MARYSLPLPNSSTSAEEITHFLAEVDAWVTDCLARASFALARQAFPDGRDHGCAAQTVNALAVGHGRENHAGLTTAVLAPLMDLEGALA